ncbi:uncharacterized protein [Eurosta solidaginis]|uniref:uncharacterized protein n=1 Tax=Eurosta solidaginis TaxID=178769 RepID=UPI003530BD92
MRIQILLLIVISISLATALATAVKESKTRQKKTATVKPTITAKTTEKSSTSIEKGAYKKSGVNTTTTTSLKHSGKPAKPETAEATTGKDKRGKRTLYDFGNAGYLYPQIASRRAGYDSEGQSYYPQQGYYNGQDAVAQFPNNYIGAQYYPQYVEAPEPIIEIIIKDSNETLPEPEPPQSIITKKRKEKVHVFYVNYKKDKNNKLHLESPIASLNNDDNEEEEEEEIVHYPVPATPAPPVKSTTLRTIIHPDSEKYHSNSGIHVTFGSEDKAQEGHQIEESDAESIQNQVVAIPVDGNIQGAASFRSNEYNTRADFGASGHGSYEQTQYQQQQQLQAQYQKQQLPPQQTGGNYFRPPAALVQQKQQQAQYQQQSQHTQPQQTQQQHQSVQQPSAQQQQPRPQFNAEFNKLAAPPPTLPAPQSLPFLQQLTQFRKTFGASNAAQSPFFFNHNQQYQTQPSNQQQTYFNQNVVLKSTPSPSKQSVFFPTEPPKTHQELPARQAGLAYQPVKFRPTLAPSQSHVKQVALPTKLENTNYQQQQQYYQQQQQQQQQQHHNNVKQQQPYQPFQFNRQPQFVKQPTFTVTSPQQGGASAAHSASTHNNYYKQTQQAHSHTQLLSQKLASSRYQLQSQNQYQTQYPQQQQTNNQQHVAQQQSYQAQQKLQQQSTKPAYPIQKQNAPTAAALQSPIDPLKSLHNYFGVQSSKETELLKSIPKYEQHITETIETPVEGSAVGSGSSSGQYNNFSNFGYQAQNQVLHDIPAPHLGPTPAPNRNQQSYQRQKQQQQQQTQNHANPNYASEGDGQSAHASSNGHYITAEALQNQRQQQKQQQQQFSNFVTIHSNQPSAYPSTTSAPPQYAQTTDGERVMIVTPMPPNAYNQYHSSQYQTLSTSAQQVLASSSAQPTGHFPVQQPRQSAGSIISATVPNASSSNSAQYSVSNYHSDVFRELEQRRTNNAPSNEKPSLPATQYSASSYTSQSSSASSSTKHESAPASASADTEKNTKATQTLLQLPDEVPDDLRQQLLSSGILNNADISILDYDKVGDVALENLPAEHLQHFYGAGGAAQISASKKIVSVVKPNGDKVALSENDIDRVKQSNSLPHKQGVDVKVVHFNAKNEKSISEKYIKSDATVVPPVDLAERQYNRYLPLKINGAQFPLPDSEELKGKKVVSVVVLAPVEAQAPTNVPASTSSERRSERGTSDVEDKEVKFVGGDIIKTLVKKPTKENFKRWLEKEARTDVEQQSVILLVAKSSDDAEQEIFMYDISTGAVNRLNGELSSAFVNVAEENASSEDFEHASTLDPSVLETMMQKNRRR